MAQSPLCSLQIPPPWNWKGHEHNSAMISQCYSLFSSLPCGLWLYCSTSNTQSHSPYQIHVHRIRALAFCPTHFTPCPQDPGEAAGFPGRERATPVGLRRCSAPCTGNRVARAGIRSSYRHLCCTCYTEAAIPHLLNLQKPLKDY